VLCRRYLLQVTPCNLCPIVSLALSATEKLAKWQGDRMAVGQTEGRPAERTLFGHPVGLANLFGVELWERFSFYGMLTILGYYLYYSVTEGGLELPKSTATGIVGAYGGLVYLSTVLGGWIADRLLGMERTVLYGGVVVMCGLLVLSSAR
jgi:proton-dependent oligopeptide transporter, POT family